jgi:hypothetical protein
MLRIMKISLTPYQYYGSKTAQKEIQLSLHFTKKSYKQSEIVQNFSYRKN